jgi:large subunit ribosomal protein L17
MRHNKGFNHLGRKKAHREAMLSNMATSLIKSKRISTTLAKAKALRGYIEPLITKSKEDSTHSRRVVFSSLQDKEAVTILFREVAQKVADRPGGYTRILKTGTRLGDNAEMCMIELVDYNELLLGTKEAKKTSRRRRGSGAGKKEEVSPVKTSKKAVAAKEEVAHEPESVTAEEAVVETDIPVAETSIEETAADEQIAEADVNADDKTAENTEPNAEEETDKQA